GDRRQSRPGLCVGTEPSGGAGAGAAKHARHVADEPCLWRRRPSNALLHRIDKRQYPARRPRCGWTCNTSGAIMNLHTAQSRRTFVKSVAGLSGFAWGLAGCAAVDPTPVVHGERLAVPYSEGTQAPAVAAPLGATDCHHHIFDPRFPRPNGRTGIWGTADDYRLLR